MNEKIPIVLIDDHPLARNGIGGWLAGTGRFSIAGEASCLAQAGALLEKLDPLPALVILDISLGRETPEENGLAFIAMLKDICKKRNMPGPPVLVCSMYEDPFLVRTALDSGAAGFISKSADVRELITAIDTVIGGKVYIDKKLEVQSQKETYSALTRREREVVSLIKRALNNRQIARAMGISLRTVENHLGHIYLKTGIRSRDALTGL